MAARANTRARLLEAAIDVFSEQGYRGASLTAIAKRAGAARSSIAWHFASKEGLLHETKLEAWRRWQRASEERASEENALLVQINLGREQERLARLHVTLALEAISDGGKGLESAARARALGLEREIAMLKEAQASGLIGLDISPRSLALIGAALVWGQAALHQLDPDHYDYQTLYGAIASVTKGALASKG